MLLVLTVLLVASGTKLPLEPVLIGTKLPLETFVAIGTKMPLELSCNRNFCYTKYRFIRNGDQPSSVGFLKNPLISDSHSINT